MKTKGEEQKKDHIMINKKPVGVQNISQSCWFGALVSCLANTTLADWCIEQARGQNKESLLGQMSELFIGLRDCKDGQSLDPKSALKFFYSLKNHRLEHGQQQDVHEALTLILSAINPGRSTNPCSASLTTTFKCLTCSKVSYVPKDWVEGFYHSLGMTNTSLQKCIDENDTIHHPGLMTKKCGSCHKNTNHKKWITLTKEPKLILLHMKRYGNSGEKNTSELEVPESLNMESLVHSPPQSKYTLHACILHTSSTIRSGHYTSLVKRENTWFRVDDESVTSISLEDLHEDCKKKAYLLIYKQKSYEEFKDRDETTKLDEEEKSSVKEKISYFERGGIWR